MENNYDLMKLIQSKFQRLSKGQKLIAEFILKHYDKAAFMTAAKLGDSVAVSESTVVRFANELGYEGYPELQKALQELIKTKLTTVQRIELSSDFIGQENVLNIVLKSDISNIRDSLEKIDGRTFNEIVDKIISAKNIYIIGLRSSTTLAEFLGFYLNFILDNVRVVSRGVSDIFEQLLRLDSDDLIIGIGFPRYSSRTIDALSYAKKNGATVIALTDSMLSPLNESADYTLLAQSNMASFVDSLVAPMSVINALIVAVGLRKKDTISQSFGKLEKIWDENKVYTDNGKAVKNTEN